MVVGLFRKNITNLHRIASKSNQFQNQLQIKTNQQLFQRNGSISLIPQQYRYFSSENENKGNSEEDEQVEEVDPELEKKKAEEAIAAKLEQERIRFNKEKEEYALEMKKLRKEFAKEHEIALKKKEEDRLNRIKKAEEKIKKRKEQLKAEHEKLQAQMTSLEFSPLDMLGKVDHEELERIRLEKKEEKAKRRQQVLEKLQQKQLDEERYMEDHLRVLAVEASSWITEQDQENDTVMEKIRSQLQEVQPLTAAFSNNLPKRHCEAAVGYLTQDRFPRVDENTLRGRQN